VCWKWAEVVAPLGTMSQSDAAKALVAAMRPLHPPSGENGMKPPTGITIPSASSVLITAVWPKCYFPYLSYSSWWQTASMLLPSGSFTNPP
jgi:hypothetical protein